MKTRQIVIQSINLDTNTGELVGKIRIGRNLKSLRAKVVEDSTKGGLMCVSFDSESYQILGWPKSILSNDEMVWLTRAFVLAFKGQMPILPKNLIEFRSITSG